MDIAVIDAIEELARLPVAVLRVRYRELFGEESKSFHKQALFRRIAWKLQARAAGDLSEKARRRAAEIADDADLRLGGGKGFWSWPGKPQTSDSLSPGGSKGCVPRPGMVLTRHYQGREIRVQVLARGFEHDGRHYTSLSAIARDVTGTRWNGLVFFGVKERRRG
jgi:hypothetical protein